MYGSEAKLFNPSIKKTTHLKTGQKWRCRSLVAQLFVYMCEGPGLILSIGKKPGSGEGGQIV